jgi:hypothetical protein
LRQSTERHDVQWSLSADRCAGRLEHVHAAGLLVGYGEQVASVTLRTINGRKLSVAVPPGWEPQLETESSFRLGSPGAVVEILVTLHEIGHRLTRQALCEAMEKSGRKRAESVVGDCLVQLCRLGVLNNRQDTSNRGYGIVGSD